SAQGEPPVMSRVQLAINVPDLEVAIEFYSRLFGTAPHKRHDGYANFAIADPPLKLVLFEAPGANEVLNHLGVEVETTDEGEASSKATSMRVKLRTPFASESETARIRSRGASHSSLTGQPSFGRERGLTSASRRSVNPNACRREIKGNDPAKVLRRAPKVAR